MGGFRRALFVVLAIVVALDDGQAIRAELPAIRFDRLTPLGAAAGSTVEVQTAGRDTEDLQALTFDHPGLTAEPLEGGRFKVSVAAEVPEGTYDARLVGRYGVSNPRLFAVNRSLGDVAEQEPNDTLAQSQAVALESAVNGLCDVNGQDGFRFSARRSERITIVCLAQKLDSELDATLNVMDSTGRILATSGDYLGRDPLVDFVAPADGDYVAVVHDLVYRGGYPYRLLITRRPWVENVFPRAVEAGKPVELLALGSNLAPAGVTGSAVVPVPVNGPPVPAEGPAFEKFRFNFTPAGDPDAYQFLEHPTGHSVLPTAATFTLRGLQARVPLAGGALNPQPLLLADGPVTVEAEPNDDPSQPQAVSLPATVSGRFDRPRDGDWFQIEPAEDGTYAVEVYSERIAVQADPFVVVNDDSGNRIAEFDDFGPRINAFDGHLRDPEGSVNLSKGKTYRVLVQDRYGRGGPRFQYVLAIRRPVPDFFAAVIHSENPGPSGTTIGRGGSACLDIVLQRRDGFGEPITLTAEGLPPGLHAAPTTIHGDTRGVFVFWADADAPEWNGTLRLLATGTRIDMAGGQDGRRTALSHEVRSFTRVWNIANVSSSRPTRQHALAIRGLAPYSLRIEPDRIEVGSGKTAALKLVATRNWPEFTEKIRAIPLAFPGNFQMPEVEIPAGQTEAALAILVQGGTRLGDNTLVVQGQAQVPFDKDPQATDRPLTLVSMPSRPVTITVVGPK